TTARRLQNRETVEGIFERLLELRQQIAVNANLAVYRDFAWKSHKRFDYTPEQCLQFADAIAAYCVPLVKKLDDQRRRDLGIDKLRPWDGAVDPKNRPPLVPFKESETSAIVDKTRIIFDRL